MPSYIVMLIYSDQYIDYSVCIRIGV